MYKKLIVIGLSVLPLIAYGSTDKFIYQPGDGAIKCSTPAATRGQGDKILGAQVWTIVAGNPALGQTDDLYAQVVTTNEEGVVTTNAVMKSNVSELSDYTKLWPQTEEERQAAKDIGLKTLENQFIQYYEALGFTNKPGFEEITAELNTWTNELDAAKQAITGLSIDAAAKRYSALWWDDCAWHPEIEE